MKTILFLLILLSSINASALRVLLVDPVDELDIKIEGVSSAGTDTVLKLKAPLEALTITPQNGATFAINDGKYEGVLKIIPQGANFIVVEEIDFEDYLRGVVPFEVHYEWPDELLKTQAILARSYALRALEDAVIDYNNPAFKTNDRTVYELTNDSHRNQMYRGSAMGYPSTDKAVRETKGLITAYNDKLFAPYYHSSCGAVGTDPLPWFSDDADLPPLKKGVKCNLCTTSKYHSWEITFPEEDIEKFLLSKGLDGHLEKVKVAARAKHKHATEFLFVTDKGKIKTNAHDFRMAMGPGTLRSTNIKNIKEADGKVTFKGNGWGHGAGLCQIGAKEMASAGKTYEEILKYYFPGVQLQKYK